MPELKEGETIDRLGYQGLRIIQNPAKFKFTMDAFLLAGFIEPKPEHNLIDLGSGGGVLALLIAGQRRVGKVYGLEIQPELVEMARRSVALNGLEEKIHLEWGDLKEPPASLKMNFFDYVVANPPFYPVEQGVVPENPSLALAKFEIGCVLEDVIKAAARLVKGNGRFALIYPTSRLNELWQTLNRHHLTPKRLCFVHPKPAAASNLSLLEALPGAKNGLEVAPPIFVYNQDGEYTGIMKRIFRGESYQSLFRS